MSILNGDWEPPVEGSPLAQWETARDPRAGLRPWGFWASLGWALLAAATAMFAVVACVLVWMLGHKLRVPGAADANFENLAITIAFVAATIVLAIAAKCRRWSLRDYFAVTKMPPRDFLLGLAALVATILISEAADRLLGVDAGGEAFTAEYREANLAGALSLFWVSVVVVAPITEELIFRGFLHRGWSASRLGVVGTIVVTSALWAALHLQYNLYEISWLFVTGLIFGWIRQRSASTTPAIALHSLYNLVAMVSVTIQVEWLS